MAKIFIATSKTGETLVYDSFSELWDGDSDNMLKKTAILERIIKGNRDMDLFELIDPHTFFDRVFGVGNYSLSSKDIPVDKRKIY